MAHNFQLVYLKDMIKHLCADFYRHEKEISDIIDKVIKILSLPNVTIDDKLYHLSSIRHDLRIGKYDNEKELQKIIQEELRIISTKIDDYQIIKDDELHNLHVNGLFKNIKEQLVIQKELLRTNYVKTESIQFVNRYSIIKIMNDVSVLIKKENEMYHCDIEFNGNQCSLSVSW